MCILALRQRVAFFARQVEEMLFRQGHANPPAPVAESSRARGGAGPTRPAQSRPWFYQGAQDLAREGHWSVAGSVKDRWDWFTSKCDSFQGTPEECSAAVQAAGARPGETVSLVARQSAPTRSHKTKKLAALDGVSTKHSGTRAEEAWITMHNPATTRVAISPQPMRPEYLGRPATCRSWRRRSRGRHRVALLAGLRQVAGRLLF